jgi:hypothetical protein
MVRAKSKVPLASPLHSQYRRALSASVVAHARYLAAQGEKSVTPRQIIQQRAAWQAMEARKARILARLILEDDSKSADSNK